MFRQQLAIIGIACVGLLVTDQPIPADEAASLTTIEELGGRYERDTQRPGKPVVAVDLNFTHATDAALKALADFPDLETLTLDKSQYPHPKRRPIAFPHITDAGLKELIGLKHLKSLNLRSNSITDAGLKELKELTALQSLDLSRTPVTGTGLTELKELTNLRSLGLGYSTTDAGLNALPELKSLQSLALIEMKVTETSLENLESLRGLQSIELRDTPVSAASLNRLRKALPDVKIMITARPLSRDEQIYYRTGK
ncbi:MAG: hypothetical protein U0941_16285 [Planctomycetaceae bacterium]